MKASHIAGCFVLLMAIGVTSHAQSKGDTLIVIRDAELKQGDTVVKTLTPGSHVKVLDVKGEMLQVSGEGMGWIQKKNTATYAKALEMFSTQIKKHPKDSPAYVARAIALQGKGDLDAAIADFTEALRLDPKQAEVLLRRGNCYRTKKEFDKATNDYTDAIQLAPDSASAYCMRADTWTVLKKHDKSIADYHEALRINPNYEYPLNQLAWLLATCPNAKYRDGKKAVDYGKKLCELTHWQDVGALDTVSAAYAEAGEFEKAVEWQAKAVALAPDQEKADYQSRLSLYKSRKAFHEKE